MKILVAEDDACSLLQVEMALRKSGYQVVSARDGKEAEEILDSDDPPPLAIIDWIMPGQDGIEVCRTLRKRKNGPHPYIILLTAKDDADDIVSGLDAGANDYIRKPFNTQELLARIRVGERYLALQLSLLEQVQQLHEKQNALDCALSSLEKEKAISDAILAAIGDGISTHDRDFRILYQNQVLVDAIGDQRGKFCFAVYERGEQACSDCPVEKSFFDGKVHRVEKKYPVNGALRHFECIASPIWDAGGSIVAGLKLFRDITEQKNVDEQLRQAQKIEAVGSLAGGIAHDFNNVLTAIIGYGHLLTLKLGDDPALLHFAQQILESAERGSILTGSLLDFSRRHPLHFAPTNINRVFTDMEGLLKRIIGEDVLFTMDLADEPAIVMADKRHLEQVVMNFVANARDAMTGGGMLRIRTRRVTIDREFITAYGFGEPGDYVCISVSDTGTGIDQSIKNRIFEPFFTTKEPGKGSGLGLSVAHGIITQHEGYLHFTSEQGVGSTFRVFLPLHCIRKADAVEETEPLAVRGSETVLVAEDEEAVRTLIRELLEDKGYTVIEAVDGIDALHKFHQHAETIRIMILDMIMPHKNGSSVYQIIQQQRPDIQAIFISGHVPCDGDRKACDSAAANFLEKPVSPASLLDLVRKILDDTQALAARDSDFSRGFHWSPGNG